MRGAAELLAWARRDMDEFEKVWSAYCASTPYKLERRFNPLTNQHLVIMRFHKALPDDLRRLAHQSANAIKHAFDQATHALRAAVAPDKRGDVYFPWRTSAEDVKGYLRKQQFPESTWQLFLRHRPWKGNGGDDIARDFASAVNANKHSMSVGVLPHYDLQDITLHYKAGMTVEQSFFIPNPIFPVGSTEFELFRMKGHGAETFDLKCTINTVFTDAGLLNGQKPFYVLQYVWAKATDVVTTFSRFSAEAK